MLSVATGHATCLVSQINEQYRYQGNSNILYSNHLTDDLWMDLKIFGKYWVGVGAASLSTPYSLSVSGITRLFQFCHAATTLQ
jgi:hypothetical protein